MRLITRCPQCETTFRVIPDQLKLAQGWVRCGRCTRVFEADQHLFELPVAPLPEPAPPDVPSVATVKASSSRFRGWWAVLAGVLVMGAGLQWLMTARHVVAAQFPELRPVLQQACQWLACELSWPLDIEAVALVSSSFEQREPQRYRLTWQWRNLQSYPVATPSVALSLTDAQDQVVVHKLLTPEMLGLAPAITPGALKSMAFDLEDAAPEFASVVGYRVSLVYP